MTSPVLQCSLNPADCTMCGHASMLCECSASDITQKYKFAVRFVTGMVQGRPHIAPSWSVHVELGRGAATFSGDGIAVQQEVPVTRSLAFEVSPAQSCLLLVSLYWVTYVEDHAMLQR